MKVVGLTGGIASGKTMVSRIFESLGVPVFRADDVAKQLLSDSHIKPQVVSLLGNVYKPDGTPDYKLIASIIFSDDDKRKRLEAIIHPVVWQKFQEWLKEQKHPYVIHEAALLFESGLYKHVDWIVAVYATPTTREKRNPAYKQRAHLQLPENFKTTQAHFVIYNDENCPVIPQVVKLHRLFINQFHKPVSLQK